MSVGRFLTPRQRHSRIQCEPCEYSTCCHESLCFDFFIFQEMSRRFFNLWISWILCRLCRLWIFMVKNAVYAYHAVCAFSAVFPAGQPIFAGRGIFGI